MKTILGNFDQEVIMERERELTRITRVNSCYFTRFDRTKTVQ